MVVSMVCSVEGSRVTESLRNVLGSLDGADELVIDFSQVRRLDAGALQVLDQLAEQAAARSVPVVLRGVDVTVYKVLKLIRLAPRFGFGN